MAPAPARLAALVSCTLLACGEQVLVAHIASEQRAQSDSLQRGSTEAGDARGALDAGGAPERADASDAAVDSGSKNDGKHDDDSDDHDKDHN